MATFTASDSPSVPMDSPSKPEMDKENVAAEVSSPAKPECEQPEADGAATCAPTEAADADADASSKKKVCRPAATQTPST